MTTRAELPPRTASSGALRLSLDFDPQGLVEDLALLLDTAWTPHFNTGLYEGDWSGIALRAPVGATHPVDTLHNAPGASDFADLPAFAHCAHFQALVRALQCEIQSVRLLRLAPGARIGEHRDHALGRAFGEVRLHIPIQTHADVDFRVAGERVCMRPGELWYIDASEPHSVHNGSESARVHLVVDCRVNDWLDALLQAGVPGRAVPPAPRREADSPGVEHGWPLNTRYDEAITATMLAFLDDLGLIGGTRDLPQRTFLPGIALENGQLWVDPRRLCYPGDLLHEAGHLAVLTPDERRTTGPEASSDPAQEMMAIAWSWAALTHLQLDPQDVFHDDGYKGDAQWLVDTYSAGSYIGLPMLQWIGLTADPERAGALGIAPYPHMIRWLRD